MGSFSVYCGISQISITDGNDCILLPLKKNTIHNIYSDYIPACLPIFGKYDDYGRIGYITKDTNTDLIEKHFKCDIETFCGCLTDNRKDEDDFLSNLIIEEFGGLEYMFIDRKVYDFLSSYSGHIYIDMGNPSLLENMGFKYIGENDSDKRYNKVWEIQNVKFHSDGTWLHTSKNANIFNINGEYCKLSDYITLDDNMLEMSKKNMVQLWEILDDKTARTYLLSVIGVDYEWFNNHIEMMQFLEESQKVERISKIKKERGISYKYAEDLKTFGKTLCEMTLMHQNMMSFSCVFRRYESCITPQCGDYDNHQKIMEKFTEINKSYTE